MMDKVNVWKYQARPDNFNPSISLPPSTQHFAGLQLAPTVLSDGRGLRVTGI